MLGTFLKGAYEDFCAMGKLLAYDCWLFSQKDVEIPNQGDRQDSSLTYSISGKVNHPSVLNSQALTGGN